MAKEKALQVKPASDKAMRTWNEKIAPIVVALNQLTTVLMGMQNDAVREMAKRDGIVLQADGGRWGFNPAKQQWEEQAGA